MLPLESPRWRELQHAYGNASDVPRLLKQLEGFPASQGNAEPWFTLWSSLCHQDDVYTASFAAVPHIVRVLKMDPVRADHSFFQLPACIEIARARVSFDIPPDLREPYFAALNEFPNLIGPAAARKWDEGMLCCVLSAIAASKGFPSIASAALELDSATAGKFMTWFLEQ